MAQENLLHSGEFADHDGNLIKVSFYQRIDMNAYPRSLWIDASGGTLEFEIWSRDGSVALGDPYEEWWNYVQTKAEPIPGSKWYKYYYNIIVDENPGTSREDTLRVYFDDGPYIGQAFLEVPLKQQGQA
jgi:hypothetical protein